MNKCNSLFWFYCKYPVVSTNFDMEDTNSFALTFAKFFIYDSDWINEILDIKCQIGSNIKNVLGYDQLSCLLQSESFIVC